MNKSQETNRDSFVLYKSFYEPISGLTDQQLGRLFRAIFKWQIDHQAVKDPDEAVNVALSFITNQFRIDEGKYQERCEKNRINAVTRWEKTKKANASNRIQSHPNECERMRTIPNDNDNENENENEIVLRGPGDESPSRKRKRFVPPSLDEVEAYCKERGNAIDPKKLFNYYQARGWVMGKTPMKDWRAAIRTWERNQPVSSRQDSPVITNADELYKD